MEGIPETLKAKVEQMTVGELCDFAMHEYGIELNQAAHAIDGLRDEFFKQYAALGGERNG
jgi:hypothetical protein